MPSTRSDRDWPLIAKMIADGYTGRKGKGGFYRLNKAGGERVKEAIDLADRRIPHRAQAARSTALDAARGGGPRALLEQRRAGGAVRLAGAGADAGLRRRRWCPRSPTTSSRSIEAMRLGFNWKRGPFELIDQLGPAWFARPAARPRAPGAAAAARRRRGQLLPGRGRHGCSISAADGGYADVDAARGRAAARRHQAAAQAGRRRTAPPASGTSATASLCLEFHSKMNALDDDIAGDDRQGDRDRRPRTSRRWSSTTRASNFSVGANIGLALFAANVARLADDRGH